MASEVLYVLPLTRSDERRGLAFIKFTRPVKKNKFCVRVWHDPGSVLRLRHA